MTLARNHRLATLLVVAAATAVALHAGVAVAASGTSHPTAATTAPVRPAPTAVAAPLPAVGDDVSVSVPPVPSQHALPGLCTAFLAGQRRGHEFDILVGATGGTDAKTSAWCTTYLQLRSHAGR